MGEWRNTNADELAGVSAVEAQSTSQLEREAAIRTFSLDTVAAAYSAAAPAEASESPKIEDSPDSRESPPTSAPHIKLTPRCEAKAAGLRLAPRDEVVPKEEGIRLTPSEGQAPA